MSEEFMVAANEAGQRLDVFCVAHLPGFSRAAIQKAIKEGGVKVNGKAVKPRYLVKAGEAVEITLGAAATINPSLPPLIRGGNDELSLPIIYEDKDVVVINKPAGVLVHPTGKPPSIPPYQGGTIAEWFMRRYLSQNPPQSPLIPSSSPAKRDTTGLRRGEEREGIVHRLDRDTSGVLILARTEEAQEYLAKQFKAHRVKKEYLALVFGVPTMKEGRINQAIKRSRTNPSRRTVVPPKEKSILAGKLAITEWRLEQSFGGKYALLRVYPLTGRTHQIRVHLHFFGYPIVGDQLYNFKRQKPPVGVKRQMLHAEKLRLTLPNGKVRSFTAEMPEDFVQVLNMNSFKVSL